MLTLPSIPGARVTHTCEDGGPAAPHLSHFPRAGDDVTAALSTACWRRLAPVAVAVVPLLNHNPDLRHGGSTGLECRGCRPG